MHCEERTAVLTADILGGNFDTDSSGLLGSTMSLETALEELQRGPPNSQVSTLMVYKLNYAVWIYRRNVWYLLWNISGFRTEEDIGKIWSQDFA